MVSQHCRLLPYEVAHGAHNMAADEVMLECALRGIASLRFYGWSEPTVSLGYFQAAAIRRGDTQLATLPFVRRPTGGMTLVHHHELTYAVALPAVPPWQPTHRKPQEWLCRMHALLRSALAKCGVSVAAAQCAGWPPTHSDLCFRHITPGDLLIGACKVGGSAQRRQRRTLLQHGAILLESSPQTPELLGVLELCGTRIQERTLVDAAADAWRLEIGHELTLADWTEPERRQIDVLAQAKYSQDSWNSRR